MRGFLFCDTQYIHTPLTKDKVVLCELCVSDLLIHGLSVVEVHVAHEAGRVQLVPHLLCVRVERWRYWYHDGLAGGQPERPEADDICIMYCTWFYYWWQEQKDRIYHYYDIFYLQFNFKIGFLLQKTWHFLINLFRDSSPKCHVSSWTYNNQKLYTFTTNSQEMTSSWESCAYHLPAKFSVRMAIILSTEPRMARWIITGRFLSLFSSPL